MTRLRAFARFWYDFIVGDDWRVAVGVGAGIALTAALASAGLSVWWLMPLAVGATLFASLWRATRPPLTADAGESASRASVGPEATGRADPLTE
jgi:hypothetical protein